MCRLYMWINYDSKRRIVDKNKKVKKVVDNAKSFWYYKKAAERAALFSKRNIAICTLTNKQQSNPENSKNTFKCERNSEKET